MEFNRKLCEKRKSENNAVAIVRTSGSASGLNSLPQPENGNPSSFSLTQVLATVSIIVSIIGLYCKRKEVRTLAQRSLEWVKPKKVECEPLQLGAHPGAA